MSIKRVGIVGCGRIFKKHFDAIENRTDKYQLVACADIDRKILDNKVKSKEVQKYQYYEQMLECENLDVVCILTPSGVHYKIALGCIDFVKTFVVE